MPAFDLAAGASYLWRVLASLSSSGLPPFVCRRPSVGLRPCVLSFFVPLSRLARCLPLLRSPASVGVFLHSHVAFLLVPSSHIPFITHPFITHPLHLHITHPSFAPSHVPPSHIPFISPSSAQHCPSWRASERVAPRMTVRCRSGCCWELASKVEGWGRRQRVRSEAAGGQERLGAASSILQHLYGRGGYTGH